MRVPVVAHFAVIPSYLHKIAIDVDDSAHCLFPLPEHTLSDFEKSGLGCIHDSRTITYFGEFREPMVTSGTHTNFVGARSIAFMSLCRTKSVSPSSQAMVTPLQSVPMTVPKSAVVPPQRTRSPTLRSLDCSPVIAVTFRAV
jgi:hypothetical protein